MRVVTTIVELVGYALVVLGAFILAGAGVATIVAGLLLVLIAYLAERERK